jgi:hypothetical protein
VIVVIQDRRSISNQPGSIKHAQKPCTVLASRILHELQGQGATDAFESASQKKRGCLSSPISNAVKNVPFAYLPVPCSGMVCGLFEALSVIVTVPVRNPTWLGVKVTLM